MAGSKYERLPEDEEYEEEKVGPAKDPVISCKERSERFWKTVFAACVFTVACTVTLLALTLASPDEPETSLLSIRQALIPQG